MDDQIVHGTTTTTGFCTRRGQSRQLIVSWFEKAICRGLIKEALYCAAELDLSGWSSLLWERLFWVGWAHIGLSNPMVPMALFDLYGRWISAIKQQQRRRQEDPPQLEKSAECIKARCVLMLVVNWLAQERKNQLILHCSASCIMESTGCLSDSDWEAKLGTSRRLKVALAPVRLDACPAEAKAVVCLCRSMVENNEHRAVCMVNLLHIWGKSHLVWTAADKLCDVNAFQLFGWAKAFIQSYREVWTFCKETRQGPLLLPMLKATNDDDDIEPERLPLFQIILLMVPGRNYRLMFPEGVRPTSLSEDKIRQWKKQADDIYSPNHSKLVIPEYVSDKTTEAGVLRGKGVEDYLNSALRVTNFAVEIPDPMGYYDRSHREHTNAEDLYGVEHSTKHALRRLRTSGAIQDGLNSVNPRQSFEQQEQQQQQHDSPGKRKRTVPLPDELAVGSTSTPPSSKRSCPLEGSSDGDGAVVLPKEQKKEQLALEKDVFSDVTKCVAGYCATYQDRRVFVDGPLVFFHGDHANNVHAVSIHTLKELFLGMDKQADKGHNSLSILGLPSVLRLRTTSSPPQLLLDTEALFVVMDIPWNQLETCNEEDDDDDYLLLTWEEEEEHKEGDDDADDGLFSSSSSPNSLIRVTPEVMECETRMDVHIRFLTVMAFRYTFWISSVTQGDLLLDPESGCIYSLRERRMAEEKPSQWNRLLPNSWKKSHWVQYIEETVKTRPTIFDWMKERCLRWKCVLELPDVCNLVFGNLDANSEVYVQTLARIAYGGTEAWKKLGVYCCDGEGTW